MTWLARFRAPRCPTCRRKLSDCPRRRWQARRIDPGRLYLVTLPRNPTECDVAAARDAGVGRPRLL